MYRWLIPFLITLSAFSLSGEGRRDKQSFPGNSTDVSMRVTYLEGEVSINSVSAETGQTVPAGATVITGKDGFCEIQFAERNIFRIEPDTITQLNIGPGVGNVHLEAGAMALLLEKLDALLLDEGGFTLTTAIASAGIRGTAFFVKVESDDAVYLCCCNGSIEMNDSEGGTPYSLRSNHHQAVRYTYDSGRYTAASAPLLYHDDGGMEHLADEIEYNIPWGKGAY